MGRESRRWNRFEDAAFSHIRQTGRVTVTAANSCRSIDPVFILMGELAVLAILPHQQATAIDGWFWHFHEAAERRGTSVNHGASVPASIAERAAFSAGWTFSVWATAVQMHRGG